MDLAGSSGRSWSTTYNPRSKSTKNGSPSLMQDRDGEKSMNKPSACDANNTLASDLSHHRQGERDDSVKSKGFCLFSVFISYNLQLGAIFSSIVKKRRGYIVLILYMYTESVADLSSQQEKAGIEVMT